MLENVDLQATLSKSEYRARKDELVKKLVSLQQDCIREKLPVVVCVDGWSASGKGTAISQLVKDLDPRAFTVYSMSDPTPEEGRYPFMARYWKKMGRYGHMTIFDKSWYTEVLKTLLRELNDSNGYIRLDEIPVTALQDTLSAIAKSSEGDISLYAESSAIMERQLTADGYLIVKCFFHVSKEAQHDRLEALCSDRSTAWRVNQTDLRQNIQYDQFYRLIDKMLTLTESVGHPWHVIPCDDNRARRIAFMEALVKELEEGLARHKERKENPQIIPAEAPLPQSKYNLLPMPDVETVSHDLVLDDKDYRKQLKVEQQRLLELQPELYRRGIPMMLVYEGWDAAGKGGNIKRVAAALDARDYKVVPSGKPTPEEKEHPFMWRYWVNLPKSGHVGIYDRSWYGRVMVERVEGFCTDDDWRRAFEEMNDFEWEMHRWGAIMLKFWINISQDEQLARFEARANDPAKAWKLTDEDWRNRDKYPQYCQAINDMFAMTSTDFAPWYIIESDDKKYARIKALKIINDAIERRLAE